MAKLKRYIVRFKSETPERDIRLIQQLVVKQGGGILNIETLFLGFNAVLTRETVDFLRWHDQVDQMLKFC
jgi:hypothetical protein